MDNELAAHKFQKIGGIAALLEAAGYLGGFYVFIFLLNGPSFLEPVKNAEFMMNNQALFITTITITLLLAALILPVVILALHERLKAVMPMMMATVTSLGIIWAGIALAGGLIFVVGFQTVVALFPTDPERAGTIWMAFGTIASAISGSTGFVGGVWTLIISLVALKGGEFPQLLNYFGIILGIAGILSIIPMLMGAVVVFSLGQMIWFTWIGFLMITKTPSLITS